jgi:hypothetical protein
LNFDTKSVFVVDNLTIRETPKSRTKRILPHLLAFDIETQRMVWGIKLEKPIAHYYNPQKYGEHMTLQFEDSNEVSFIHAITGEITATVSLPYKVEDGRDFHLSPEGFCYQLVGLHDNRRIVSGRIVNWTWQPTFESAIESGALTVLSTHAAIYDKYIKKQLILFGPTGASVVFERCLSFHGKGDKLYVVQRGPEKECILSVITLINDGGVISEEVKTVHFVSSRPSFLGVSENGICILLERNGNPIFVNPLTSQVVKSVHQIVSYAQYIVNGETGDLWSWDTLSSELYKINGDQIIPMGKIKAGESTRFIHITSNGRLFIL